MSEQLCPYVAEVDQNYTRQSADYIARGIERSALMLATVAIEFASVERMPRYVPEKRENDAEHSFMLSLIASDLAAEFFPDLDPGLVARLGNVHDLPEIKTGDVATFAITEEAMQAKLANESLALEDVCALLPATTAELLRIYEEQRLPEARFVRFIDKLLPVLVDIIGPGSQVMHEDYATFSHEQLEANESELRQRFEKMFPDQELLPIHIARNSLAQIFSEAFTPAPLQQDTLF